MAKKILIIDDTASDRKITQRYLTKEGYDDIITAESGEDGVAMAARLCAPLRAFDCCRCWPVRD